MFYFRFAAGIIILFLLILLIIGEPEPPLPAGTQAPEAHLTSYDDRPWRLSAHYGLPIIVNFWATWCGPCRYEIPHLVSLQKKYESRLQVFGFAMDSPAGEVAATVDDLGINYPVAKVDAQTVANWRASAVPATYLLNKKGEIVWSSKGAVTRKKLHEVVDTYLFSAQ